MLTELQVHLAQVAVGHALHDGAKQGEVCTDHEALRTLECSAPACAALGQLDGLRRSLRRARSEPVAVHAYGQVATGQEGQAALSAGLAGCAFTVYCRQSSVISTRVNA
jgi:hypothetical protein